jgi:hypothetical protein
MYAIAFIVAGLEIANGEVYNVPVAGVGTEPSKVK